ncbi:MAG: hypothetical protein RLZZ324_903 [Candidatus Parcubacteria bacterium]|jgi:hypothetical protein
MLPITTSKDLLFVVLAFCALWITVFLSWLLYYVIAILRDAESLVHTVRHATEKVDRLASIVHEKFDRSAASFSMIATALKELIVWGIRERANMGGDEPKSRKRK